VRLTSDPQSSMTEVNSWQESLTEAAGELAWCSLGAKHSRSAYGYQEWN
jgi:hypothetical protein